MGEDACTSYFLDRAVYIAEQITLKENRFWLQVMLVYCSKFYLEINKYSEDRPPLLNLPIQKTICSSVSMGFWIFL